MQTGQAGFIPNKQREKKKKKKNEKIITKRVRQEKKKKMRKPREHGNFLTQVKACKNYQV